MGQQDEEESSLLVDAEAVKKGALHGTNSSDETAGGVQEEKKEDRANADGTECVQGEEESNEKKVSDWPMKNITEPHDHDVLYGRGGGTNHHPGNKRYRKMVEDRKLDYVNSKRLDKPLVALEIIKVWRGQNPPGRFLKLDEKTGMWNDVGDKKAREKTNQALREKAPFVRKQQEEERCAHDNDEDDPDNITESKSKRFAEGTKNERGNVKKPAIASRNSSSGPLAADNEALVGDDQAVARSLQALEWSVDPGKFLSRSTSNVAASSSSIDEQRSRSLEHAVLQQDSDFLLAQRLQEEENELASQKNTRLMEEKGMMLSTSTGKALKLVEAILAKVESFSISSSGPGPPAVGGAFTNSTSSATTTATNTTSNSNSLFEAVAKDTMVFMAEKLLELRASWRDEMMKGGKHTAKSVERLLNVDIGFHYTNPHNLETIRTDGLLSRSERQSQKVGQASGGEFFGNGIYTGNNPFSFMNYGTVGLIVARLQGHVSTRENTYNLRRHNSSSSTTAAAKAATLSGMPGQPETIHNNSFNTIVGNKLFSPKAGNNGTIQLQDEVVLKSSAQVVPLVKFDLLAIQQQNPSCHENVEKLWDMIEHLQAVIDEYCNDGHQDVKKPLNQVNRMTWADFSRRGST